MKKILFFFTLFTSLGSFAQVSLENDYPGNPLFENNNTLLNRPTDFIPEDYAPVVLNVQFHVVNDDNGSRTIPIGEEQIMNVIRDLNIKFGEFKIYFKYQGFNEINETDYLTLQIPAMGVYQNFPKPSDLQSYSVANNYHSSDAINIFIVDAIQQETYISCTGDLNDIVIPGTLQDLPTVTPAGTFNLPNIFMMAEYFNTGVMLHEVGHIFGLRHTNRGGCNNASVCEHVTRDPRSPDYNADITGDYVADTPASPSFYTAEEVENCIYIGLQRDCINVPFKDELVPIRNYMNINLPEHIACQDHFTPGQGVFMRENIEPMLGGGTNFLSLISNTILSLYQPFEILDVAGNDIISITPIPGGATVCRNILMQNRFQKGFHYVFVNTQAPDAVSALPDDIAVVKNVLQFKVKVLEFSNKQTYQINNICTRGMICVDEMAISGSVVSTPFLGSPEMTFTLLNEAEVNDPLLIESLESNQFHIITIEMESGVTSQMVIYKE